MVAGCGCGCAYVYSKMDLDMKRFILCVVPYPEVRHCCDFCFASFVSFNATASLA